MADYSMQLILLPLLKIQMKKIKVFIIILLISYSCFSQVEHIKLLIGETESQVIKYFDSLNNLKRDQHYKTYKDLFGSAPFFKIEFALCDQKYYSCLAIIAIFLKENGIVRCGYQRIVGDFQFEDQNLSFLKDNFDFVSDSLWEKPYSLDKTRKIKATYEQKIIDNTPKYFITYILPLKK